MSKNLRAFTRATYVFDATVQRVGDDMWDSPSPCEDWTARDVVAHQSGGLAMIAGFAGNEPAPADAADPKAAWTAARDSVFEALDQPGALQTVAQTPWGEMSIDRFLAIYAVDPIVHTWDLAMATAQEPVMPTDLVEAGIDQLTRAGDAIRHDGVFGPAVDAPEGADPIVRLAAIAGRSWA